MLAEEHIQLQINACKAESQYNERRCYVLDEKHLQLTIKVSRAKSQCHEGA